MALKNLFSRLTALGNCQLLVGTVKYWNFYENFERYFSWISAMASHSATGTQLRRQVRFIQLLQTLKLIHECVLMLYPQKQHWAMVNFDYIRMVPGLSSDLHLIFIIFMLMSISQYQYLFFFNYRRHAASVLIPGAILAAEGGYIPIRRAEECRRIRRNIKRIYSIADYAIPAVFTLFMVLTEAVLIRFVYTNREYFFGDICGLASLLLMQFNAFHFMICLYTLGFSVVFSCSYSWYFTYICFTRIRLVNQIFAKHSTPPKARTPAQPLPFGTVQYFNSLQMQTLVSVFSFNQIFGRIFLLFILINLPLNTFFGHMLLNVGVSPFVMLLFAFLFFYQTLYIIIFHIMAAMYCPRLNASKRLLRWSFTANHKNEVTALKLSNYIALYLSPDDCYGITYGGMALVTTFSFFKFLLAYGEFSMYWQQLV